MAAILRLWIGCLIIFLAVEVQAQPVVLTLPPTRSSTLSAADQALMYGDYENALAQYATVMATENACEGVFGQGVTYDRMRLYTDAIQALSQYIDGCNASFRALVLRGDARQQAGDAAGALADYEAALNLRTGLIDSYLFEQIAAVNPDASVLYLRLAAEARREPQSEYVLRNELGQIYRIVGRPDEAIIQYDAILNNGLLAEEQRDDQAALEVQAATLEIALGNTEAGYARLQRVIATYTDEPAAFDALIELINAGQQVDLLTRMRINVRNENYAPVVGVLSDYLANPPAGEVIPAEMYFLLGRSRRALGDYGGALGSLQQARDLSPGEPLASAAALEMGQTYADAGDNINAITSYLAVVSTYPQSAEAPRALLRAARIAGSMGDGAQALTLYDQLAAQYPGTEQTREGLFEAARALQQAEPTRAAELYGRAGSAQGFVWQGKLLQTLGNPDGARQAWEAALSAEPGSYFSMRACALLNNTPAYETSGNLRLQDFTAEDIATAETWMAQTFGMTQASAALAPELAAHPLVVRGSELWALGWAREANAEFVAMHRLYRDDPLAMFQLATYYRSIQAYRAATIAATRLVFLANTPLPSVPAYVARLAYPIYFPDLVITNAQTYGLDPLYVASLIRQESTFDATALSIAGARGLMQLMPATAQDVAGRLGLSGYSVDDLARPIVNIEMGSFYLGSTRDFLDGDVVGALLGYNAGPGRAAEWIQSAGGDLEVLYRTIPFEETRLYLETTYRNFAAYRALYGDGMPDCMFSVPPSVSLTPTPASGSN